jgi:hypothetical protein
VTTLQGDYPHAVPAIANLRWKENWLFVAMAPRQHFYGLVHLNAEPAFGRMRITCNLSLPGRAHCHSGEIAFPADWESRRDLGDEQVTVRFREPHRRFEVELRLPELEASLNLRARHPTFDFAACRSAAPENPSFKELMTLGTNLTHEHHQQALTLTGTLSTAHHTTLAVDGLGYRDHSWCMRADSQIAEHTFSALMFDNRVIGVKTAVMLHDRAIVAREGYVSDTDGSRALRRIDVRVRGAGPDGVGGCVNFDLQDVAGERFTVHAQIAERLLSLPLVSEKPGARAPYRIIENLCPIMLRETGETGWGHIELGLNPLAVS